MGIPVHRILRAGLRVIDGSLSWIFQPECAVCARSGVSATLCPECDPIRPLDGPICGLCGDGISQVTERCGACLDDPFRWLHRARSLLWLSEEARKIVHRVKYGYRFEMLDLFRPAIRFCFEPDLPADFAVCAVPMHPKKLARRGFNQADLLVEWLVGDFGLTRAPDGLVKEKETGSQTSLTRLERQRSLSRCFGWRRKVPVPSRILLVDDIYTTGATLEACAKALRKAGAREVFAWTLFRTPLLRARVVLPQAQC